MKSCLAIVSLVICLTIAPRSLAADPPENPLYDSIVQDYLAGKWDDLEATLKAKTKEINAFVGTQKTDLVYIRQSLSESHPIWWNQAKAGKKMNFRQAAWGRSMDLIYDPAGKGGIETKFNSGIREITVSWTSGDMDNAAEAEHGFSKGELNNSTVFATIGLAHAWSTIPTASMMNLTEKDKAALWEYLDFRGNITGVYYGSPRGRQWDLWLYLHSYQDKYAKMATINGRKSVAVMFMDELITNKKKYPSIKLPAIADDVSEDKFALALSNAIEKAHWTLAEDRSIREAAKALGTANDTLAKMQGRVKFSNGTEMALDPEADGALKGKREGWLRKQK